MLDPRSLLSVLQLASRTCCHLPDVKQDEYAYAQHQQGLGDASSIQQLRLARGRVGGKVMATDFDRPCNQTCSILGC